MMNYDIITILGPTASGKTSLATRLAYQIGNAEIISADSRQVYRGMDIGTGKDLNEYTVEGTHIPYHLIDIVDAGEKYNLFHFQQDFWNAYHDIRNRGKVPILCGGTGLYIESILKSYKMVPVPENPALRKELASKSLEELTQILSTYKTLHNTTDVDTPMRAIRAIEIQQYYTENSISEREFPQLKSLTIGVSIDRDLRRQKISKRLNERLQNGMLAEVEGLLEHVSAEDLMYYGLEYKYLTMCAIGQLSYQEMVRQLEIAIHQFAKRQMTWFRGMERRGISIVWQDAQDNLKDRVDAIIAMLDT
ncbi:MAG: tRNA (adenosine(37)-N6)-dimethylallyltransferase MiaA [Bacteroidaceae bacterium]|nr:tRNA (adenosine(37)-N6)-dimethylallyltransferase MiaA [Bacteroidaceae bacterium]